MAQENMDALKEEIRLFASSLENGTPCSAIRKIFLASLFSLMILLFCFFALLLIYPDAVKEHLPFLVYTILSSVFVAAAVAHQDAYRQSFSCMEGMMIGMTTGMMSGFLFGGIVGATNGMFIGSITGIAYGSLIGAYSGKCCGIMGILEGLMAGLMGGTMGAMLTVMMIFDNLHLFIPILLAVVEIILLGLSVMIASSAAKRASPQDVDFAQFFARTAFLAAVSAAIILFAPKSASVVL